MLSKARLILHFSVYMQKFPILCSFPRSIFYFRIPHPCSQTLYSLLNVHRRHFFASLSIKKLFFFPSIPLVQNLITDLVSAFYFSVLGHTTWLECKILFAGWDKAEFSYGLRRLYFFNGTNELAADCKITS
jgi:hypothetical protein